jgi:hypothetical protein
MKFLKIALLGVVLEGDASCKTRLSSEMVLCHNIASEIKIDFIDQGLEFPASWEELRSVRMIREGSLEKSINRINIYNKFAIVPGCPELPLTPQIPKELIGMRLFLIQRNTETDIYSYAGRAAILIGPETEEPVNRIIKGVYLKEEVALSAISQAKGFDPMDQPPAFEDEFIVTVEERKKDMWRELGKQVPLQHEPAAEKVAQSGYTKAEERPIGVSQKIHVIQLIGAIFLLILGCLVWRLFRIRGNLK